MPVETIQRHGFAQGARHGLGGGLKVPIKMAAQPTSQPTPIVFIVDDDVSVRESLELLIGAENLRAETFASAQEFLSRPRAPVPSCLILDLALPDLHGLDVQKRIADRVDIPIIFLTGYGDDGSGHEGRSSRILHQAVRHRRIAGSGS